MSSVRFGDRTTGSQRSPSPGARTFGGASNSRFGRTTNQYKRQKKLTAEEALELDKKKALEPFQPEKIPPTFMYVSVSGIIQSGSVSLILG